MSKNWPAARRMLRQAVVVSLLESAVFAAVKVVLAYPFLFKSDLGIGESSKVEGINRALR